MFTARRVTGSMCIMSDGHMSTQWPHPSQLVIYTKVGIAFLQTEDCLFKINSGVNDVGLSHILKAYPMALVNYVCRHQPSPYFFDRPLRA